MQVLLFGLGSLWINRDRAELFRHPKLRHLNILLYFRTVYLTKSWKLICQNDKKIRHQTVEKYIL